MIDQLPAIGDTVITWYDSEPVIYGGPHRHDNATSISFDMRHGTATRQCNLDRVAPADIPIPVKDARITVIKHTTAEARQAGSYYANWAAVIPLAPKPIWARTKRQALADAHRCLAILDWHAAQNARSTHHA